MAVMAANASFFTNYTAYRDMASCKLAGTRGTIDVHAMIKTKYASSWGMLVKARTKVNLNMHDREQKGPKTVQDLGLGTRVQDDLIFQQKFCIRSYEVGPDGTASVETLMHYLQESAVNHMIKTCGLMGEGFASVEMSKKNLIWVMAKMQMIVDRYPSWGDIIQIDTWRAPYRKHGVLCSYIFYDSKTGETLVRSSSILVMMNKKTKKLSIVPNEVRAKLDQSFLNIPPILKQGTHTWSQRVDNIQEHICKGLTPKWSDLDINKHVNNVKYVKWILQSVPKTILENYEIDSMALEYCREVTKDTVLQSITSILVNYAEVANYNVVDCQHSLQFEAGGEIMKGGTRWRLK